MSLYRIPGFKPGNYIQAYLPTGNKGDTEAKTFAVNIQIGKDIHTGEVRQDTLTELSDEVASELRARGYRILPEEELLKFTSGAIDVDTAERLVEAVEITASLNNQAQTEIQDVLTKKTRMPRS